MARRNTSYRRRRPRRRGLKIIVILIIIAVAALAVIRTAVRRYAPTNEKADVSEYYNLTSDDSMMVTINNKRMSANGIYVGGRAYLPIDMVESQISNRFFWDSSEKMLRYVTADNVVSTSAVNTKTYYTGRMKKTADSVIAREKDGKMYLSADFIRQFADVHAKIYAQPRRIAIVTKTGKISYTQLKHAARLRTRGGNRSPVIANLKKGSLLTVTERYSSWVSVVTEDGLSGYVKKNDLGSAAQKTYSRIHKEEEHTHLTFNGKISMAWHQVTNTSANSNVNKVLDQTKGVNVIAPTWFYLNDNKGNIASYASRDYVSYCHKRNVQVWGLVSNLENSDVSTATVLNTTSSRDALINNLIATAIQYDLDGINVDFESLNSSVGYGFIEFIRELSVKCANNELYLSVDNYPPSAYTKLYFRNEQAKFADYVVLMAYDEHFSGSKEAGSTASLPFVKKGVAATLKENVPANQLILGMPFYTRLWREDASGSAVSSKTVDMEEADQLLKTHHAQKTWKSDQGQNYAEYTSGGSTYKIWLEDADSLKEKLNVMKNNRLAGAAFWKLGYEEPSVWNTISSYLD